jgi:hypothetical protein
MNIQDQLQSNNEPTPLNIFYDNLQNFVNSAGVVDTNFQNLVDFFRRCRADKAAAYSHFSAFQPSNQNLTQFLQALDAETDRVVIPLSYFLEFKTFFKASLSAPLQSSQYL